MSLPRRISAWLLVCVLACLFILSTAAPRMWRNAGQMAEQSPDPAPARENTAPLSDDHAAKGLPESERQPTSVLAKGTAVVVRPVNHVSPAAPQVAPPSTHFEDIVETETELMAFPPSSNALVLQMLGLDSQGWPNTLSSKPIPAIRPQQLVNDAPPSAQTQPETKQTIEGPSFVAPADKIGSQTPVAQPGVAPNSSDKPNEAPAPSEPVKRLPVVVANIPSRILPDPTKLVEPPGEALSSDVGEMEPLAPPSESKRGPATRHLDDSWQDPKTLLENLTALAAAGPAGRWASEVIHQIQVLGPAVGGNSDTSVAILERLTQLSEQAAPLAAKISDKVLAKKVRKASYALDRRIAVWQEVVRLGGPRPTDSTPPDVDPQKLAKCLTDVEALTGDTPEGRAWRDYLLVDALNTSAKQTQSAKDLAVQQIAQQVLIRLTQTPLTPNQQKFVASGPVAALRGELRRWAAEPVGAAAVLRDIETYERTCLPSDASRLACNCQNLTLSSAEGRRQLADRLDAHYRNANFRLAVTEELINKLIPEQSLEYAPVNDTVLGRPVQGESLMATELAVRMAPDPHRVRLVLEVRGEITSATTANAGSARFHNDSESSYIARKPLEIDMNGISVWPVEVGVENDSHLSGVETPLDWVPLFGPITRGIAKSQSDQNKSAASQEVKQKIASQARERVDAEARQRLSEFVTRMNERVFDPLSSLSIDPQLIDAETTAKRFTMRLRLAGEDQLGSHTPRPQAPGDSLASLQVHESVINNAIQRLQLNGRTFTLPELSQHIADRLSRPTAWETNPEHADVKITFAEKDAIVVRCQDGQVLVALSIAQLSKSPRKWKNFRIEASYRPKVEGRSAQLVRDGVIRLIGRLNMSSQIALRGIFSHALSKNNGWDLVPEKVVKEPKLADAAITQFLIDDGWIGVAMGPKPILPTTARRQSQRMR
jgi:hypothetical protein